MMDDVSVVKRKRHDAEPLRSDAGSDQQRGDEFDSFREGERVAGGLVARCMVRVWAGESSGRGW